MAHRFSVHAFALAAVTLGSTFPRAADAVDQVVDNCSDDTELRADLTTLQSGGGRLSFNCDSATIVVMAQLPDIDSDTTIDGGDDITLTGLSAVRLFRVNGIGTLTLKNIVVERGYGGSEDGGAIYNDGHLLLDNATVRNSFTPFRGGGIFTHGRVEVTNSTLAENIAGSGGAIHADGLSAQVSIFDSTFDGNSADTTNRGGAIYASGALSVSDSELRNNRAGSGGAIYARAGEAGGAASITGCVFTENRTTGMFPNANGAAVLLETITATISRSTLRENSGQSGGAIYILPGGLLTLVESTLSDNTSTNGGGIYNKGTATVIDVTIARNGGSGAHGGGIDNFGMLVLTNVTLSDNDATYGGGLKNEGGTATLINVTLSRNSAALTSGAGIFNTGANTHLDLKNVIIADSPVGDNCKFSQPVDSAVFSLSSDDSCGFGAGHDEVDVMLGPLRDNGGFSPTHLPKPGSAAIDDGTSSGAPTTDQRGVQRPQGAAFDVGSVEVGPTCAGDCGRDGQVRINELLVMVNVALERALVAACSAGDRDQSGRITIDEILVAVNNALRGCGVTALGESHR